MCYKFCCFGTSEPLALRPAARKNSSSIRLLLTSPSRTCHGSHRTSCQDSVGHTGATTLEACLDFNSRQLQGQQLGTAATQHRLEHSTVCPSFASRCEAPRASDVIAPTNHVTQESFFVSELVIVIYEYSSDFPLIQ